MPQAPKGGPQQPVEPVESPAELEARIRREERDRLAAVFTGQDVREQFPEGISVEMVAFLLRLNHP